MQEGNLKAEESTSLSMRQLSAVVGSSHRYIPPDWDLFLHSSPIVTSVLDGIHGVHM